MATERTLEPRRIQATYARPEDARRAIDRARAAGLGADAGRPVDERAMLRSEMRDEVESTTAGPGSVGPFTKGMTRGIATWVPIATAIGALLGALLGLIPWDSGLGLPLRLILGAVIGAAAGATAGFVGGGAFRPREHDEPRLDAERGVTVGVAVHTDAEARRARDLLESAGPIRVAETDEGGAPVRPTSEDATRPLRGD